MSSEETPSEETPLLSTVNADHNDVYLQFSPTRKKIILLMASACGLLNRMFIDIYTPFFLFIISICGWDVYTFNTTYCQGSEYNWSGYQVIRFRNL